MTMMMTSSQFGLEDMEALLWPSSPMADAMESPFAHPDEDVQQKGGESSTRGSTSPASPLASLSPSLSASPPPFYSPPPSPLAVPSNGDKTGTESDLLSSWLDHPGLLRCSQAPMGDSKDDVFGDFDWMGEKVDLSDFDLDSLIGCSPAEEAPSSPEDLLDSLGCSMELDSFQLPPFPAPALSSSSSAPSLSVSPPSLPPASSDPSAVTVDEPEFHIGGQEVPSSPFCVPDAQEELEIKSEPASPDPPPAVIDSPSSPAFTLDLGSEVDISECEVKPVVASVVPQVPRIVLSLSKTRIVLVLAPKNETTTTTPGLIQCSPPTYTAQMSTRSRPYPEPKLKSSPSSPAAAVDEVKSLRAAGGAERAALKAPKDKKQKKMEQNKTAATRYRQKKKAEQDTLLEEYALLERRNVELTEKAESMAREIEYLKELMEEVRQTRLKKGLSADP